MASVWPVNAAPSEARNSAVPTTSSTVPKRPSVPRIGICGDDEYLLKSGPDGVTEASLSHPLRAGGSRDSFGGNSGAFPCVSTGAP